MLFTAPMMTQMFASIIQDVAGLALQDVKNPYLKAALGPVVDTFTHGLLNNLPAAEVGQQTYDQVAQALPEGQSPTVSPDQWAGFYGQTQALLKKP